MSVVKLFSKPSVPIEKGVLVTRVKEKLVSGGFKKLRKSDRLTYSIPEKVAVFWPIEPTMWPE